MDSILYIPAPVWVQAVFVCLFILFALSILYWTAKESKANRDFIAKLNKDNQENLNRLEDNWKGWLSDQSSREQDTIGKMTLSLEKMADKLEVHDDQAKKILGIVVTIDENTKPRGSRKKVRDELCVE
jgi:hypothetical protein